MTDEIKILVNKEGTSTNIVQLPTRKFPALAIQGDSWSIYSTLVDESLAIARSLDSEDLIDHLEQLKESIDTYKELYETVLEHNGIDIPYSQ